MSFPAFLPTTDPAYQQDSVGEPCHSCPSCCWILTLPTLICYLELAFDRRGMGFDEFEDRRAVGLGSYRRRRRRLDKEENSQSWMRQVAEEMIA
jgi:hypothetical protein